jgi:uncharacterized integral membrane protein (TIGR00698 family)
MVLSRAMIVLGALFCLTPWASSASALVLGVALALIFGNPYSKKTGAWTPRLLAWSIIGLGAGMDLETVGRAGAAGIGYTAVGILLTFGLGMALRRWIGVPREVSVLITVGTAICGGSAIAAAAPTIRARPQEVSVALGTVFLLNALALVIFPPIGHALELSQGQFGLWSALAIHDTSSVVGSTLQYGDQALEIGTTVKLARALWIVPVTLFLGWLFRQQAPGLDDGTRPGAKRPWFILGFLLAAALVTLLPFLQPLGHGVEAVARKLLVLVLFLIGSNITQATLRSVGARPLLQGVALWILVASGTLGAIKAGWIAP